MNKKNIACGISCCLALLVGCGGGGGGKKENAAQAPALQSTKVNVQLVNDGDPGAIPGLELDLQTLELKTLDLGQGERWSPVPLAAGPRKLPGSAALQVAQDLPWAVGNYTNARMDIGPQSKVLGADGQALGPLQPAGNWIDLRPEAGGSSFPVKVNEGRTTDLVVLLETAGIQANPAHPGQYLRWPSRLRLLDRADTVTLSGKVTGPDGVGLPGIPVLAQPLLQRVLAGAGLPERTTRTGSDGSFTLDLLSKGGVLCVTTQPVHGSQVYEFTAESFSALSSGQLDLKCQLLPAPATLHVTLPPGTNLQTDRVDLLRTVDLSSGKVNVLARTAFAEASSHQQVTFQGIAPGNYYLKRTRYTVDTHGKPSAAPWAASPALTIGPGTSTHAAP